MADAHTHGSGVTLEDDAKAILRAGLDELLKLTAGLSFRNLPSGRYPLPAALMVYSNVPEPDAVRDEVRRCVESDPLGALDQAMVLLELFECNQPGCVEFIPDDPKFLQTVFASKRCNGWISVIGNADRDELERAINSRWQFRFIEARSRETGIYALVNMLVRYAFVYGRIAFGDGHALGHFIEDYTPGLIVCRGAMSDLELTLSLAAMKMGIPAVVPPDYPFALGRSVRAEALYEIADAVVAFPNIRRLIDRPSVPSLPDCCDPLNRNEEFDAAATWGDTPESFYIVRKGKLDATETLVAGRPEGPMGVVITIDAEPMDAFDRRYIERLAAGSPSLMRGVRSRFDAGRLVVEFDDGAAADAKQIGDVLSISIRREYPKLNRIRAEVIFDRAKLAALAPQVREELAERERKIARTTEESVESFVACVACSPFAPDHVCILTPQRPPQCGQAYEQIKLGAQYGWDDPSNIHHSQLHRGINSRQLVEKGLLLDELRGEWQGANEAVERLSKGRTRRIQLHAVEDFPTTGCGCFRFILFQTDKPTRGIGVMDVRYEGTCPDGRSWIDLKYALAGKQAPTIAGCGEGYFRSTKFIRAHGGWGGVVWVSPKVAEIMGTDLPEGIAVGP